MSNNLESYLPYFPFLLLGFLGLAGALLLRILYAYSSTVGQASLLKNALAGPLSFFQRKSSEQSEALDKGNKPPSHPRFYQRWKSYLTPYWSSSEEELSPSFIEALKTLKDHFPQSDYKYKLPWYLMIGAVNSGKSQILQDFID